MKVYFLATLICALAVFRLAGADPPASRVESEIAFLRAHAAHVERMLDLNHEVAWEHVRTLGVRLDALESSVAALLGSGSNFQEAIDAAQKAKALLAQPLEESARAFEVLNRRRLLASHDGDDRLQMLLKALEDGEAER
jgi:hypothetical protein